MKVAVFGKHITQEARPYLETLYEELTKGGAELVVYRRFNKFLKDHCDWHLNLPEFHNFESLVESKAEVLITVGGDGTLLDAATLVQHSNIPLMGINLGRLGFLATVAKEEIKKSVRALLAGHYRLDSRYLLNLTTSEDLGIEPTFALNEVSVSRKDTTAMVTVHVWINEVFLNSYWADGLIIATPTGSTGYSLSCGGPIIMPGSQNFVITPIAPHNLNVRPFVIPNDIEIRLKVEGRGDQFLVSLDSRIYVFRSSVELTVRKANFKIALVQTEHQNFPSTLRNKLLWGIDRRN